LKLEKKRVLGMRIMELSMEEIIERLRNGKITICVVGLGRVGFPTAYAFADAGVKVIGVDIDDNLVKEIVLGQCPLHDEPGFEDIRRKVNDNLIEANTDVTSSVARSDVIIVCVPTPINESKVPHSPAIVDSCKKIGKGLKEGSLVVIESTVSPGMIERDIIPLLERQSGMKAGANFGVASCPERANPGEILKNLKSLPRIVGGITQKSTDVAAAVYSYALGAQVLKVSNAKTANAVKLTENIFRDVNIALMNEFAVLYEKLGIDTVEVINACATKWNFIPHYPGAGVGGPCLPANAYYIIDEGLKVGYIPHLVRMAREINDRMPEHVVVLTTEALNNIGKVVRGSKIAVLGVSYKPDVHDVQNSPVKHLCERLKAMGAHIAIYDPLFKGETVFGTNVHANLEDAVARADCIILGTGHAEFKHLDLEAIAAICRTPTAFIDATNALTPQEITKYGFSYVGVGRP
jgi:nucleotide sugar dehydrogenase